MSDLSRVNQPPVQKPDAPVPEIRLESRQPGISPGVLVYAAMLIFTIQIAVIVHARVLSAK